jgi:UDP-N-acetyl-D-mannosaminuronic acid dehydrogenase
LNEIQNAANSVKLDGTAAHKPVVACLGLTFKPDIDDLRESPALEICKMLCDSNLLEVVVAEPNITQLPDQLLGKVELLSPSDAIERADVVVLLVDHRQFKDISRTSLGDKKIIDTRGLWRR